jgi:triacylglycerol esterase/lipase EstA (alpha/beta hydrolase family)
VIGGTSPRRRVFLGGAALLVVAVVLAAFVLTRLHRTTVTPVAQDRPGPIVLVPGYGGGVGNLEVLATRLRQTGRDVTILHLPGDGTGDLDAQADALDQAVKPLLDAGAPSVDLVGYSAGGVVVRLWVRRHDGQSKARRIVTLGSPNHGASLASFAAAFAGGSCPAACRQLVPGSAVLDGLNSGDETPDGPQWVSLWTEGDEVVTPPDSGSLTGAVDLTVQQVCPGHAVTHGELPADPVVAQVVARALAVAPFRAFTLSTC